MEHSVILLILAVLINLATLYIGFRIGWDTADAHISQRMRQTWYNKDNRLKTWSCSNCIGRTWYGGCKYPDYKKPCVLESKHCCPYGQTFWTCEQAQQQMHYKHLENKLFKDEQQKPKKKKTTKKPKGETK